jgi:hypothetical protein
MLDKLKGSPRRLSRRIGAASAVAMLLAAPTGAALALGPWQVYLSGGPEAVIAPADAAGTRGFDVLEPAVKPPEPTGPVRADAGAERAVQGWTFTGGGGGHGKPSRGG